MEKTFPSQSELSKLAFYPYIPRRRNIDATEDMPMAVRMTSIRLDTRLADEAAKVLGVKSRTEAIHLALTEIVELQRFKDLMKKYTGKLSFEGHCD
jgi:Arc/MetJ family transcription regulator